MTFKKLIIILTITVSLLMTTLLGTSYAWYQFDNAVTSFNNVSTYDDSIGAAVIFENSDNFNTNVGVPIFEHQVSYYSDKTTFTMTTDSEIIAGRQIAYQISLMDIKIDNELTVTKDLKYSLIETVNGESKTIKSGDFQNFTGDTLVLKDMTLVEPLDTTYYYEFRLWLQDNGCTLEQIKDNSFNCSDQNALMGKRISGKIKVSTALK